MARSGWERGVCQVGKRRVLANRARTEVLVKRGLRFDPAELFRELDRLGFPLAYAEGLRTIHFTVMTGSNRGLYFDDEAWVDVSREGQKQLVETFVHELAHHVDEQEDDVSQSLARERLARGKLLRNRQAREADEEFLAIGFERFYSRRPSQRARLRERCPRLYRLVRALHRRYSES